MKNRVPFVQQRTVTANIAGKKYIAILNAQGEVVVRELSPGIRGKLSGCQIKPP